MKYISKILLIVCVSLLGQYAAAQPPKRKSEAAAKEAVAGLELVDHDFYLFVNQASGHVEAVYRRSDGKIGHLIPKI